MPALAVATPPRRHTPADSWPDSGPCCAGPVRRLGHERRGARADQRREQTLRRRRPRRVWRQRAALTFQQLRRRARRVHSRKQGQQPARTIPHAARSAATAEHTALPRAARGTARLRIRALRLAAVLRRRHRGAPRQVRDEGGRAPARRAIRRPAEEPTWRWPVHHCESVSVAGGATYVVSGPAPAGMAAPMGPRRHGHDAVRTMDGHTWRRPAR